MPIFAHSDLVCLDDVSWGWAPYHGNLMEPIHLKQYPDIKSVAASTAIWRQNAPSADALASDGLKFLKSMETKYLKN